MISLQRLNMDNTFIIDSNGWKILVDPWLHGTEVDYFPWFNTQWHRTKPVSYQSLPEFDTVLITQKYPDHFHVETLKKLEPKEIIAPASIEKKLKKLLPNSEIISLRSIDEELQVHDHTLRFLPTSRKIDPIYDALIIDNGTESIFLATHGFKLYEKAKLAVEKSSGFKLLVTPMNHYQLPIFLGGIVSPGIKGLQHLFEAVKPDYIVATHDEDKHASGIVTKFASIRRFKTDDLQKIPEIAKRFLEINDYQRIQIA